MHTSYLTNIFLNNLFKPNKKSNKGDFYNNGVGNGFLRNDSTLGGWKSAKVGNSRPSSAQGSRQVEREARSRSASGWRRNASLISRPNSASGYRGRYGDSDAGSQTGELIVLLLRKM